MLEIASELSDIGSSNAVKTLNVSYIPLKICQMDDQLPKF